MASVSISCAGDRQYVSKIALVARKRSLTMGMLVRAALDAACSDDLNELDALDSFFAPDGENFHHSGSTIPEPNSQSQTTTPNSAVPKTQSNGR